MKKSEIYKMLQYMVLNEETGYNDDDKLEILRELMEQEDRAKFFEEQEANAE